MPGNHTLDPCHSGRAEGAIRNPEPLFEFVSGFRARADARPGMTAAGYFRADGHGAPQGAQAPAKSSGDTGRPIDGEVR